MHHPQPRHTPGWNKRPALPVHLAISNSLPGWEIAAIATVAVLLAAALALAVYRIRVTRQRATPSSA